MKARKESEEAGGQEHDVSKCRVWYTRSAFAVLAISQPPVTTITLR
jgi:hypothetical protein